MFRSLFLASFCVGVMVAFCLPERGTTVCWLLVWCAVLLGSGGLYSWRQSYRMGFQAAVCVLLLLIGMTYAVMRTQYALSQQWVVEEQPKPVSLKMMVVGLPERDENQRVQFLADVVTASGQRFHLLMQDYAGRDWAIGSVWQVEARVRAPVAMRNWVGFDSEAWALAEGIDGSATLSAKRIALTEHHGSLKTVLNRWREHIALAWQQQARAFPDGSALMRALTIGDTAGLSPQAWVAFRPLGINHLISISGLHVTMFAWLMAWVVTRLFRFLPRIPQRPHVWTLILGWLAAAIYTALAGAEVPAVRSLLMLAVFVLFWLKRGWVGSWYAWWLAMAVVLLYQPMAVLAVGFWLSFGLVGALMWVLAWRTQARVIVRKQRWIQALMGQWAATLCGGVATVFLFGTLPVFSPLVNAVAIPWFSWVLVPLGLLASVLPMERLHYWVAFLAQNTMNILLFCGQRLPEISFAHAPSMSFGLAIFASLLLLLPKGTRLKPLAVIALLAFALYRPTDFSGSSHQMRVSLKATVFDVGQGLAVLLQTRESNVLFDTAKAGAEWTLLPNLRAMGVRQLDTLIVSHHDNDHDGGLPEIRRALKIGRLLAGQPEFYAQAQDCRDIQPWQQDGVYFELLTLPRDAGQTADNRLSCVLRVIADGRALLITGDLDSQGEQALLVRYGRNLQSDVLILGHHGSRSSSSSSFINAVAPKYGVASSGFANAYRHPHPDVQTILRAHGVQLWRTDKQGMLVFEFLPQGVQASALPKAYWWQKKPF